MKQRRMWVLALVQLLGVSQAEAKNCETAADCGGAPAICERTTYQTCAGKDPTACPAGSACGDKPTSDDLTNCAPYVEGLCRQPYELPCVDDADCGVGFRCEEQIGQACSGWATTGGNGVPPSSHQECHETRGTFACVLVEKSCATDKDCTPGLRCLQSEASTCARVVMTEDGAQPKADCPETPKLCAPQGYFGDYESEDHAGAISNDGFVTSGDKAGTDETAEVREGDGGCSLAGPSFELSWLALAALIRRRRR